MITEHTSIEASESQSTGQNRPGTHARWICGALAVIVLGGWPAYAGFCDYKTRSFRLACETAREQSNWRSLREVSLQWIDWDPAAVSARWNVAEACNSAIRRNPRITKARSRHSAIRNPPGTNS